MPEMLIIGSEGFIGSHLVKFFKEQNWNVTGVDLYERPAQQYRYHKVSRLSPELSEIFNMQPYDICINAGGSGNVTHSMTHPLLDFEANTLDTIRVLDNIRKFNSACRYIHISSAAVYGSPETLPINEATDCRPISPYGWHKLQSELLCREYAEIYNVRGCIIRPFSIYGPGLKKQLFWDVFCKWKQNSKEISLWGTGYESRDFVFISDVAEAIKLLIANATMKAEVYNLASGKEIKIINAVQCFLSNSKTNVKLNFTQDAKKGDPIHWQADIAKLKSFGFAPKYSLQVGLRSTFQWLLEHEKG